MLMEAPAKYEELYGVRFIDKLGNGKDGSVFKTSEGQAIKLRAYQIFDNGVLKRSADFKFCD